MHLIQFGLERTHRLTNYRAAPIFNCLFYIYSSSITSDNVMLNHRLELLCFLNSCKISKLLKRTIVTILYMSSITNPCKRQSTACSGDIRYLVCESISRYHVRLTYMYAEAGRRWCVCNLAAEARMSVAMATDALQADSGISSRSRSIVEASRAGRNELPDNILDRFIQFAWPSCQVLPRT